MQANGDVGNAPWRTAGATGLRRLARVALSYPATLLVIAAATAGWNWAIAAPSASAPLKSNATKNVDAMPLNPGTVPFSSFASSAARKAFEQRLSRNQPSHKEALLEARRRIDLWNEQEFEKARRRYAVNIAPERLAGIRVDRVTPREGVAQGNRDRILINLHGGAFQWGAHFGGLAESIPVSAIGRITVITLDYRQAPEFTFPAASEDVTVVYRELLKTYKSNNIGIYGTSAGGILTGQIIVDLDSARLPLPGAIGIVCAGIEDFSGDSSFVGPQLTGEGTASSPLKVINLSYFAGADSHSARVFPANEPQLLSVFPPTLLMSSTRDFALSTVVHSEQLLSAAGVTTELHVWDGLWHAFLIESDLPESRAANAMIVRFFDRYLGARHRAQ